MTSPSGIQQISEETVCDLMERELEDLRGRPPAVQGDSRGRRRGPALRRADELDDALAGQLSRSSSTSAKGNSLTDVDGNDLIDFCLGDTGAMTGHSPRADRRRGDGPDRSKGSRRCCRARTPLPLGEEMVRRFGLRHWQFSLSATDANRFSIRLCREVTGRDKILVFNHCYHGSVDETVAMLKDGEPSFRVGNIGPPVPIAETTRVVEFNDVEASSASWPTATSPASWPSRR